MGGHRNVRKNLNSGCYRYHLGNFQNYFKGISRIDKRQINKQKIIYSFFLNMSLPLWGCQPHTPTRDLSLDPIPLRGHSPLGRRKQLKLLPCRDSVGVLKECQGLPYGVSLRLPLDTLRLYRLRRNGVKGGRSPFTLPLTEREPTHLPARDRVATLSLCPTASD